MTLRTRLLFITLLLSLTITLSLSWVLWSAWQKAERLRFDEEFKGALAEVSASLDGEARSLQERLEPVCAHDPQVDAALVGLNSGRLDDHLLRVKLGLEETRKALGVKEMALVTDEGELLSGTWAGSAHPPGTGEALLDRIENRASTPGLRPEAPLAFEAACRLQRGNHWVALVASSEVSALLDRAGKNYGLSLSLVDTETPTTREPSSAQLLSQTVELRALGQKKLRAERSRLPLSRALQEVTTQIVSVALGIFAAAFLLALLISRSISKPIADFARRTRSAIGGSVEHLPVEGGAEIEEAARAFNRTLDDLDELRERLQITERIAARREVARQVAHEIKNPLSPIRTSIETLRKLRGQDDELFDEFFDEATSTVLDEVRRIADLVRNFSEYARLPSPTPAEFDLGTLSSELVNLHQGLGAELRLSCPESLPVIADRDQIKQVLTNLLKNAIEATEPGANPRKIEVTAGRTAPEDIESPAKRGASGNDTALQAQRVWVEVNDSGPGVSDEMIPRLFEPYVTSKQGGTGLGLPISHRIAIEHGGDLTYSSRPEGGASFRLVLPRLGPPASSAEQKDG